MFGKLLSIAVLISILFFPYTSLAQNEVFIGISYNPLPDSSGIELTQIVRHSPADIAGLELGDVILSADGKTISCSDSLSAFLQTKTPGDRVKLSVQRCKNTLSIPLILGKRSDFQGSLKAGGREVFPKSAEEILPDWRADESVFAFFGAVEQFELDSAYNKLAGSFRQEFASYAGFYMLDLVSAIMLEPASCVPSAREAISAAAVEGGSPIEVFRGAYRALNIEGNAPANRLVIENLDQVIAIVQRANSLIDSAFIDLEAEELQAISDLAPFLLNTFCKTVYIHTDENEELVDGYYELIASTKKIRYEKLVEAGEVLAALSEADFTGFLSRIVPGEGADLGLDFLVNKTAILGRRDSSGIEVPVYGRVIVSGFESMTYSQGASIWIDLGGDDTYLNHCGGTPYTIYDIVSHRFSAGRSGLHIDFAGDDKYIRKTEGSIGSGFCGAGCLLDFTGDDIYSGNRLCQGASFCGTGLLFDSTGEDIYLADECAQGFAAFGVGLLFDGSGDDLFQSTRYSQGVGVTKGLGMLVDCSGDDRYIASHKHPNGYGNEDTWEGWSQGVGMGFRTVAEGGIGILCDREGDDYYEAGNFSQACGYFLGLGILNELGGDDVYIGNRYVQGAGAHQAAGCFIDHSGDDRYRGNEAVNQGGAWDIVSAWFVDMAGDDYYYGTSLSQGGAAQSAIAVCLDLQGVDSYIAGGTSNGSGGGLDYHSTFGDRNIGLQIDQGGAEDDYSMTSGKRKNNSAALTDDDKDKKTGDGIFIDR